MITPSQLKNWEDIDQSKASIVYIAGYPELYGWLEYESGIFYPHRKPTISEIVNNEFI